MGRVAGHCLRSSSSSLGQGRWREGDGGRWRGRVVVIVSSGRQGVSVIIVVVGTRETEGGRWSDGGRRQGSIVVIVSMSLSRCRGASPCHRRRDEEEGEGASLVVVVVVVAALLLSLSLRVGEAWMGEGEDEMWARRYSRRRIVIVTCEGGWVRTRDWRDAVVRVASSLSSHVRVGEDEAWARRCCHCVVIIACGGRERRVCKPVPRVRV